MNKDSFIKHLIVLTVSFISIIAVFAVGMIFIKDAEDDIGLQRAEEYPR